MTYTRGLLGFAGSTTIAMLISVCPVSSGYTQQHSTAGMTGARPVALRVSGSIPNQKESPPTSMAGALTEPFSALAMPASQPGALNPIPVPEPSRWVMIGLGFFLLVSRYKISTFAGKSNDSQRH